MDHPFPKSVSLTEKCKRLVEIVTPEDTLGVMINADPDSIASAVALKRIFWRKVKKAQIYRINSIKRTDNLAMIKLLKIEQKHVRAMNAGEITKWALVDSQPHHDEQFSKVRFDIIIDHHPPGPSCAAAFVDIREEYGANSTVLTEYLRAMKIKPSPTLATALFYGIRTDTDNFTRPTTANDLNAFRYLYPLVNIQTIKKIESSGWSKKTIRSFREAMDQVVYLKDVACIHMGKVNNPDLLVLLADSFVRLAEVKWSVVSGIYAQKLIVIFRNAGFRLDAGKVAQQLFGNLGSAGGHRNAARAEIPMETLEKKKPNGIDLKQFVLNKIREI